MPVIVGPPANAIRNRPITPELRDLLDKAADDVGIERVVIVSGGQTSNHAPNLKGVVGGWTGSPRHDNGRAADIELVKAGRTLSFSDDNGSEVEEFVTACAARGATGIGAGVHYMGRKRIHVGFGKSSSDLQQLVWGAAGASANAPTWLRTAARNGWIDMADVKVASAAPIKSSGRSIVMARGGLWLRRGPGLGFDRAKLLDEGTQLTILGLDGEWARVDLQGDGLIDGHVFAAFLADSSSGGGSDADDGLEEIVDEGIITQLVAAEGLAGIASGVARTNARPARTSRKRSKG